MSARETHITANMLNELAGRPWSTEHVGLIACEPRAGMVDHDGPLLPPLYGRDYITSDDDRTLLPTCSRCAVLRDEALEGRLARSPAP